MQTMAAKQQDRKLLSFAIRIAAMTEISLLFGEPLMGRSDLIRALRDLQARHGCIILALDSRLVVSERHISFATEKALLAFSEGRNVAKDLGVEIMRYASGERQIERALAIGASNSTKRVALLLVSSNRACPLPEASELSRMVKLDAQGCSFDQEVVRAAYNISAEEIDAAGIERIPDLVVERVALVDTCR